MRFHMPDNRRHRRVTKSLLKCLREVGVDIGHTAVADLAARLYGYADRNELDACVGRSAASLFDEDEAPGIVAARKERQAAVLVAAGVSRDRVGSILKATWPTARTVGGASPRPVASSVTVRSPAASGPRSRDSVDTLLDDWDDHANRKASDVLAGIVGRAYEGAYTGIDIVEMANGTEQVRGRTTFDDVLLNVFPQSTLAGFVLAQMQAGQGKVVVELGGGPMGMAVEAHRIGNDKVFSCLFEKRKGRSPAPLEGFIPGRSRKWIDAILANRGFHLICVGSPSNRSSPIALVNSLVDALRGKGMSVLGCLPELEAATVHPRSHETVAGPTSAPLPPLRVLVANRDESLSPRLLWLQTRSTRRSYVVIVASESPDGYLRGALEDGVASQVLRGMLISTTVWNGTAWDVTVRHPAPESADA